MRGAEHAGASGSGRTEYADRSSILEFWLVVQEHAGVFFPPLEWPAQGAPIPPHAIRKRRAAHFAEVQRGFEVYANHMHSHGSAVLGQPRRPTLRAVVHFQRDLPDTCQPTPDLDRDRTRNSSGWSRRRNGPGGGCKLDAAQGLKIPGQPGRIVDHDLSAVRPGREGPSVNRPPAHPGRRSPGERSDKKLPLRAVQEPLQHDGAIPDTSKRPGCDGR